MKVGKKRSVTLATGENTLAVVAAVVLEERGVIDTIAADTTSTRRGRTGDTGRERDTRVDMETEMAAIEKIENTGI